MAFDYSARFSQAKLKLLKTPTDIKDRLDPFSFSLVSMDSRIGLHSMINDMVDDRGYIPTKHMITMPFGLPSMAHEIAHMVECPFGARLTKLDWGMQNLSLFMRQTRDYNAEKIFQAISKECRVRGIQSLMQSEKDNSWKEHPSHWPEQFLFKNATWIDFAKNVLPYGRFSTIEQVYDWALDIHNSTHNAWSLERIRSEWVRRLDYVREWMETETESKKAA